MRLRWRLFLAMLVGSLRVPTAAFRMETDQSDTDRLGCWGSDLLLPCAAYCWVGDPTLTTGANVELDSPATFSASRDVASHFSASARSSKGMPIENSA